MGGGGGMDFFWNYTFTFWVYCFIINFSWLSISFFPQEVEKLLIDDFGFVTKQLTSDITDAKLQALVGDPLLKELDTVSVVPIEAVKKLSEGELCSVYYLI